MLKPLEMTRLTLMSRRSPVLRTPKDVGLDFEDVSFTASDGVPLVGWFIPRAVGDSSGAGPVVVFVHGWMWNRLGNVAGAVPFTDRDVDFLPAVKALHDAGYHVLLFDLANHGESGSRPPVTYGPWESRDYLGAVAYLRTRGDVDEQRIGVLGLSMGGNAAIYGTPYCQPIKAMLLVQPSRAGLFTERFAKDQLGRLGTAMVRPLDLVYAAAHAPLLRDHDPGDAAVLLGDTLCKYVQGTGDPWGAVSDVQGMVDVTPNVLPLVLYPSTGRYEGYRYITEQPEEVASFFTEYL